MTSPQRAKAPPAPPTGPKKTMVAVGPSAPISPPSEPPAAASQQQPAIPPPSSPPVPPVAPTQPLPQGSDFRENREQRVGTHISGTEGLHEPTGEKQRLRLMAGRVVPGTRYRILRWLGEGGMGVVYEAEHIDIERKVALKILRFDLSQQERMAQVFRDEARAASRIGSEQIVEIYDFGELQDGRLFFCMELLDGHDLVPASEGDWVTAPNLIAIMRQMAKGLGKAHDANIVHRDIKPENVILVADGVRERVKIVDFGISAMLAANQGESGSIAGTPHYMAPEQISGGRFDGRLDMYAMGCMSYELLVGHPPFQAEELEVLLTKHIHEAPIPPSTVRPDRDIPPQLEAVIMRCLAKTPDERFANMADLEAALCEAQIAAGISTPWDDLALPEVDDERREYLLRNMPTPLAELGTEPKRRWLWPVVAATLAVVAGLAIYFAVNRGPTEQEVDQIAQIASEANEAAARTHWVYPPPGDPKAATSFRKVKDLEELEGSAEDAGDEKGAELRQQFAGTLIGLGDQWWQNDATRRFARDYYWQALLFDESNEKARERAGYTPGALAELREKAANGTWTEAELRAAQFLGVFAEEDEAKREEKADELLADAGDDLGFMVVGDLEEALRGEGARDRPRKPRNADEGGDGAEGVATEGDLDGGEGSGAADGGGDDGGDGDDGEVVEDEPTDAEKEALEDLMAETTPGKSRGRGRGKKKTGDAGLGKKKRDPKKAKELADKGKSALKAGRRSEAESLFNQAISYDRNNAKALSGLSDVYFDWGRDQKAVLYAERAVKVAPKNATYRLKLGDAYYKILEYRDAKEQYTKAKDLGSSSAQRRLDKVKAKLGG